MTTILLTDFTYSMGDERLLVMTSESEALAFGFVVFNYSQVF